MRFLTNAILLLLCITTFCHPALAQSGQAGSINGTVKTSDGSAVAGALISIKGSKKTFVNDNGTFAFKNITPGTYTITASFAGLESKSQQLTVVSGQTTTADFILKESSQQLNEIVISAGKSKKLVQRETESAARMPLKNLENAQVYNTVSNALMVQQLVVDRSELYLNIPGAVPNFSAGGSQGISQRGFSNTNGMRNRLTTSAIYPMNPAVLERLEVMKGPSGTLFGTGRGSTFGGAFNYVTKRPLNYNLMEVSLSGGSFDFMRTAADVNAVLNSDKTLLFRVNTAWQSENSFQTEGFSKNFVFAPTLSMQVNKKLSFLVDVEITKNKYTTTSLAITNPKNLSFNSFRDLPWDYKQALGDNDVESEVGVDNIGAEVEYKLSNKWKSETKFLLSQGYYDHLLWGTFSIISDSKITRSVRNQTPETFGNLQLQQNFIGDFSIGKFRNRIVAGLDYNRNYNHLNRVTVAYDTLTINKAIPDFNTTQINAASAAKKWDETKFTGHNYSAYVSNVFNVSPALMVMASLRAEYYKTDGNFTVATGQYGGGFDQTALSPKLGIVFQPIQDKLSLFGNYMNGFAFPVPVKQQYGGPLSVLKPQYGDQIEGGVKFAVLNDKITGSVSYYNIKVTNSTRTEAQTVNGRTEIITIQDGTQRSEGAELDLTANLFTGFNIIAGYAYNENKYIKASPALTGKYLTASPNHVANLWMSYAISKGKVKGLGFGAGGNYVSDSWFESTNTFILPSYKLINAAAFYDKSKYRISFKANNISDEQYWNATGMPQKSRYFLTELRYKF